MLCQLGRTSGLFRALTFESHHVSRQAQTCVAANTKIQPTKRLMESLSDFFGPLPLNSTPAGSRAMSLSRKPQVVGEQNESGPPPESKTPGRTGVIPGQPAGLNPESGDDQREIPGSR
jgi:hypothetical protein